MQKSEITERARFVRQGKVSILMFDVSNLEITDARQVVEHGKTLISGMEPGSVLTLTNVTNVVYNDEFNALAKALTIHNKPYVRAGAVVGVSGWLKVIYCAALIISGRDNLKLCASVEEAKDWLAGFAN